MTNRNGRRRKKKKHHTLHVHPLTNNF